MNDNQQSLHVQMIPNGIPDPEPAAKMALVEQEKEEDQRNSSGSSDPPQSSSSSYLNSMLHKSIYAIFGSSLRIYMGRFFGRDCEATTEVRVDDFLTPLSSQICVTASGTTMQRGGALFIDLPANLLGSFLMGLITPYHDEYLIKFPWLPEDHRLHGENSNAGDVLHQALSVGLCGSLTTYASWNTQMVVMMSGAAPLGTQVVPAIFGYFVGIMTALQAFRYGRICSIWMQQFHRRQRNNKSSDDDDNNSNNNREHHRDDSNSHSIDATEMASSSTVSIGSLVSSERITVVLSIGLITAYAVAYFVKDISFYRDMFLAALLTPIGALGRFYLSRWNGWSPSSSALGDLSWFPIGTFSANMLGAILSSLMAALLERYYSHSSSWTSVFLRAISVGLAGSLSTVSTFVKEITLLAEKYPTGTQSFRYAATTMVCGAIVASCIYIPIVRL